MGRSKVTESLISEVLTKYFEVGMTIGDIELWLKDMGVNFSHATVVGWIEQAVKILEPQDKPLQRDIILSDGYSAIILRNGILSSLYSMNEGVESVRRNKNIWKK